MNRITWISFVFGGVASFLCVASTQDANALTTNTRQYPPSLCVQVSGGSTPAATSGNGQVFNSSSSDAEWICPVINDTAVRTTTANDIFVNGYVNQKCTGTGITGKACRTFGGGGGGACNTPVSASTSNNTTAIDLASTGGTAWSNAGAQDTLFADVTMGGTCSGSHNVLFSYVTEAFF